VGPRWVELGHSVTLVASRFRDMPSDDEAGGLRIKRVGRLRDGSHHYLAPGAALRHASEPDVLLESVNTIPYLLPLRRRLTTPFLTLVHQMGRDLWSYHLPAPLACLARRLEPCLYAPYKQLTVAAVSCSTKVDLEVAGVRNVRVLPQGGPGPQPLTVEKEREPTFLYVGRLSPNKRPDHALEAFRIIKRELSTARLWMIGDGPMRPALIRQAPAGTRFFGRVDRRELLERMGRAHLLLVTSVREGWGLVVTEANACGSPAIAYDVPGLRDSVRPGETGWLTEARPEALAKVAVDVVQASEAYASTRERAHSFAAGLTWDRTARDLLALVAPERTREGAMADRLRTSSGLMP
jgi:glycosyltransferase involved in cell wall biosynthesis